MVLCRQSPDPRGCLVQTAVRQPAPLRCVGIIVPACVDPVHTGGAIAIPTAGIAIRCGAGIVSDLRINPVIDTVADFAHLSLPFCPRYLRAGR